MREKELLLGLFCRLFASMREQKNSRNSEIRSGFQGYIDCIKAVAEALEFSLVNHTTFDNFWPLLAIFHYFWPFLFLASSCHFGHKFELITSSNQH